MQETLSFQKAGAQSLAITVQVDISDQPQLLATQPKFVILSEAKDLVHHNRVILREAKDLMHPNLSS